MFDFRSHAWLTTLTLFVSIAGSSSIASAIEFGTGINSAIGGTDFQVRLAGAPEAGFDAHPIVVRPYPWGYEWLPALPGTAWVSPRLDENGVDAAYVTSGTYLFEFHFALPDGFRDPALTLEYLADNAVSSVALNGRPLPFSTCDQQTVGRAETAEPALFVAGDNVLSVAVDNWPTDMGSSPVGLNLRASVVAVPEPSVLALTALWLTLAALCRGGARG